MHELGLAFSSARITININGIIVTDKTITNTELITNWATLAVSDLSTWESYVVRVYNASYRTKANGPLLLSSYIFSSLTPNSGTIKTGKHYVDITISA